MVIVGDHLERLLQKMTNQKRTSEEGVCQTGRGAPAQPQVQSSKLSSAPVAKNGNARKLLILKCLRWLQFTGRKKWNYMTIVDFGILNLDGYNSPVVKMEIPENCRFWNFE